MTTSSSTRRLLNVLTDNALVATGNVVIPVIPEKLNANSLQIFAKQLTSLEPAYGDINRLAIMCNRVEQNSEHRDTIEEIKSAYSLPVFEIPKRTDLTVDRGGRVRLRFRQGEQACRRCSQVV